MSPAARASGAAPVPSPDAPPPVPAPAPARRRIAAQARFEATTLLRNGEQLLVAVVLPCLALAGLAFSTAPSLGDGRRIDVAVPGILALAVVSTSFTGQAIATGFDRRYGVLRLFGTTPLGRSGLLAGKVLAVLAVQLLQALVVGGLGLALGWEPRWVGLLPGLLVAVAGTWAFVALALALAGALRAEAVLAVANLVWVLLLGLGGVVVPRAELPGALSNGVAALPSSALGDGLREAFVHGRLAVGPVLVLLLWGVGASLLAARTFRWGD